MSEEDPHTQYIVLIDGDPYCGIQGPKQGAFEAARDLAQKVALDYPGVITVHSLTLLLTMGGAEEAASQAVQ